jgi:hypothetical protein
MAMQEPRCCWRYARRTAGRHPIPAFEWLGPAQLANGRVIGGGAFGVGGLAHLLRNRFYIGEVVYRGETFRGDHELSV